MRDDEFCEVLTSSVPIGVTTIMIIDACNSGSVADLHDRKWAGRTAFSLCGCQDHQTSSEREGVGSILTSSILIAIENLDRDKNSRYSVADLWGRTLHEKAAKFSSFPQKLTFDSVPGAHASTIPWPLVPVSGSGWKFAGHATAYIP